MSQPTIWHGSNSRRFRCDCGRLHEWPHGTNRRRLPEHLRRIVCDCGREHRR